jgi:DNA primase
VVVSFPDTLLDDIRARVSLVELIGRQVRLVRRGREYVGLCPFHSEKTPSFTVNEQKGFYHCFGCGAHGSVFDFVMQAENVAFPEAVARLAGQAGIALPPPRPADPERERERRSLFAALDHACRWFEAMLAGDEGAAARAYLAGRGLDAAAVARFRLGFAPAGRSRLRQGLAAAGLGDAVLVAAGLLIRPEDDADSPYDRFRSRVMFPILDERGRIVGFGGRLLGPGDPKYLNTPETALFHKGRLLYGLPAAQEAARRSGRLIVVEGYMDQIGLTLAGYPETVAPLGTALTEDQLERLWRLAPEPILCFDPDAAGRRAALRACERALPRLRPGLGLRFAFLATGTGDDPDAVAKRYPPQFLARAFAEAVPLSTMLTWLETGGRLPAAPEARAALAERLRQRALTIADQTVRQQFLGAFREALRAPGPGRPAAGGRRRPAGGGGPARRQPDRFDRGASDTIATDAATSLAHVLAAQPSRLDNAERCVLAIIINNPALFSEFEDQLGRLSFRDIKLEQVRQFLVHELSGADIAGRDRLIESLKTGIGLDFHADIGVQWSALFAAAHAGAGRDAERRDRLKKWFGKEPEEARGSDVTYRAMLEKCLQDLRAAADLDDGDRR